MSSPVKREALFNEIKGSLFEYLVARELSSAYGIEASFLKDLPTHYQSVLTQQDRMTRELYPELVQLLPVWARDVARGLVSEFPGLSVSKLELTGLFGHTNDERRETDFLLHTTMGELPVSLKLNKRGSAVNTKSGGVKSFLTEYFPGPTASALQASLSLLVDSTFAGLHAELHETAGLPVTPGWEEWKRQGLSELPGELAPELSHCLHRFYAVLARELRAALEQLAQQSPAEFQHGLERLLGMGLKNLVQVICFHDLHGSTPQSTQVLVHRMPSVVEHLRAIEWRPQRDVSFVTLGLGGWELLIRIKPMNKFTTTAIKINCAVKF